MSYGGEVTTFAGTGVLGTTDGLLLKASFRFGDLAADPDTPGRLYVHRTRSAHTHTVDIPTNTNNTFFG